MHGGARFAGAGSRLVWGLCFAGLRLVRSLRETTRHPIEIIVIDNASNDGNRSKILHQHRIRYVQTFLTPAKARRATRFIRWGRALQIR